MSPVVAFVPLLLLLGADTASSMLCTSEAPAPSPPVEWTCWGTLRWSEEEVEEPVDGTPMARQEETEGLEVEDVASVVVYTDIEVSADDQHRVG